MTAAGAFRRAWALRRPYLALHILATVLAGAVVAPLVAGVARLAAGLSGAPAVADQDIARLLLSPVGLVGGVVLASVVLAAAVLETAAMIALDDAARRGEAPSPWRALLRVAPRIPAILGLAAVVVVRLGIRALPFLLAAALAARALLGGADINFYLTERPPAFLWAIGLGAALALAMGAVLGERLLTWVLALPAVVLGGAGPRAALAASAAQTAGRRRSLLGRIGGWAVLALALTLAASALAGLAARLLTPDPAAGLDRLALHILLSLAALTAVNVVAAAAVAGSLSSLLAGLHAETIGQGAPAPVPVVPRGTLPFAALLAGAAVTGAVVGSVALVAGLRAGDGAAVIAHRGAAATRPENTLPAIEQAIAEGADWIEIDVQETADGAVIVVHDSDFMKLAGVPLRVWDGSLAEIQAIDVGAWFGPEWAGTRVPTLGEVLDTAKGRAKVLIELKHYGRAVQLEERVAEIVEAAGMADSVAAMSLDHPSAARMKALRPDWTVGLLAATAVGDLARLPADFLAVSARLATPALFERARRAGRPVHVWTVNDPVQMSRFVSLGAAGLITDRPGVARAVLAERAEMTLAERLALLAADLFGVPAAAAGGRDASP